MLRRALPLAIAFSAATCPPMASAQTGPVQYGVCASQVNLPTIYVSGVLQGPASSAASIRTGFTQFLAQRYGYKGAVGCLPAANAAAAEKLIQDRSSALRNAKKNVIETGWTESAAPAAKLAGMLSNLSSSAPQGGSAASAPASGAAAATPVAARTGTAAGTAGSAGSGTSGSSGLTSVLASIFGSGSCAGGAGGKSQSGGAGSGSTTAAASGGASTSGGASGGSGSSGGSSGSGSGDCQSTFSQVSGALSSAFSQKSGSGGASTSGQPAHSAADGLGSAQAQNTRLVIYGCGRQDTQVACVTDLTNQDKTNTLVQSADLWKDTFIVDDRGDRHQRSRGFFLNIDGDQRTQLDVSYNQSARFILMFDDVQSKVQKVSLRSKTGGLDVEDITLIASGTASGTAPSTASDASH